MTREFAAVNTEAGDSLVVAISEIVYVHRTPKVGILALRAYGGEAIRLRVLSDEMLQELCDYLLEKGG